MVVMIIIPCIDFLAFSTSPSFNIQQIDDDNTDWINMTTREFINKGERSTDILAVNYFSNGKFFNATLWLYFPFNNMPTNYSFVNYGMLIDADFNSKTGFSIGKEYGIDYQLEIQWNNETKTWTKILQAWSPNGSQRTLDISYNYTDFYEIANNFVILSLDLSSILYPDKYKIIFYAETKEDKDLTSPKIADITRWIAIPPLELLISNVPAALTLRPGEEKTIELKINSTKGFEPTISLTSRSSFGNDISSFIEFDKLRIPSHGIATTPMTIKVSEEAVVRPYTLFIIANSTFPPEELIESKTTYTDIGDNNGYSLSPPYESENIISESTIMITVQDPLTLSDRVSDFWNKLGSPIAFFYGIIAGILPWLLVRIKNKLNKK